MAPMTGIGHTEATKNGALYKRSATVQYYTEGLRSSNPQTAWREDLIKTSQASRDPPPPTKKADVTWQKTDQKLKQNQTKTDKLMTQIPKQNLEDLI